jgi:hypothetical protein
MGVDGVEDAAVDTDEVTGDHGREDALDTLLLYCGPRGGTGGISSDRPPAVDGCLGGVAFRVRARSSADIFVELFHSCFTCRVFTVGESAGSSFTSLGDASGVRL